MDGLAVRDHALRGGVIAFAKITTDFLAQPCIAILLSL